MTLCAVSAVRNYEKVSHLLCKRPKLTQKDKATIVARALTSINDSL